MTKKRDIITASEVSEFLFCAKAWQLKRDGAEVDSPHLVSGIAFHRQHANRLTFARVLRRAAWVCLGFALLALLFWML
jgi:hypothetical protein